MSERTFAVGIEGGGEIGGWEAGDGAAALILHGGPGLSDNTADLAAELSGMFERCSTVPGFDGLLNRPRGTGRLPDERFETSGDV